MVIKKDTLIRMFFFLILGAHTNVLGVNVGSEIKLESAHPRINNGLGFYKVIEVESQFLISEVIYKWI